jgi:hypothetical protein
VVLLAVMAVLAAAANAAAQAPEPGFADALLGRWNLVVEGVAGPYPSWLEVRLRTEQELMGRFVGRVGSVRHVSELRYAAGRVTFTVPVQYERRADALRFEGMLRRDRIEGTTVVEDGSTVRFSARRAPSLVRPGAPQWGEPVALFNGRNLAGWRPRDVAHAGCWSVQGGALTVTPPCGDLLTDETFTDFRLHAELRYPQGSNSGVYLRGRYEVQIQDDAGKALDPLRMGAVYGMIAPSVAAARAADEWQTLDVELVGRRVSVVLNGTTIIDGQEIPGITGGALDADESAPGPILLQGDHGPIEFRRITLARPLSAR